MKQREELRRVTAQIEAAMSMLIDDQRAREIAKLIVERDRLILEIKSRRRTSEKGVKRYG